MVESQTKIQDHNEKIMDIIFKEEEVTWQTILFELVKSEQMSPWDVDVSKITKKYIDIVKQMEEFNFRISGKILLAAALLLKMKSKQLIGDDLDNLDRLFASKDDEDDALYDGDLISDLKDYDGESDKLDTSTLIPRTPQPRKRKVSIYDLVDALQQALEVKHRRVIQSIPELQYELPKKSVDVSVIIKDIYFRIKNYFSNNPKEKMTFNTLIGEDTREAKVYAFVPLLHLTNQRKVDLHQEEHFGDIHIELTKKQADNLKSSS